MSGRVAAADRLFFHCTELDRTNYPEFRDRIVRVESEGVVHEARSYPGVPRLALDRVRPRPWVSLEGTMRRRRSCRVLSTAQPSLRVLGRILHGAHGVNAELDRGPVPSGGGLQALELYAIAFAPGGLEAGVYHYDRRGHHLSRIVEGAEHAAWLARVPSMVQFEGGGLLWVLVGDGARVERKYGPRAFRFLLLEAGHLMQNLCLLSSSVGWCTLPLGGFFEKEIARELRLPAGDVVLYLAVLGRPAPSAGAI
ncbi:MAG: SagB/ThcOx family dehydrogenase [Planctomycetes bacterium]|nr:SagB/ThcOx family dehydrogenase [Planctomycetota bacterium]